MPEPAYAPRHRRAVRRRCAWALGLGGSALAVWLHFVFFPAFRDFASHADCRSLWGIPGYRVAFYGGLVLPALLTLLFAACLWPSAWRVLRSGQYPPPGRKTFRRVRIRYGWAARLRAWLAIGALLGSMGLMVYAVLLAESLAERYRAAYPNGVVCESEAPR